MPSTRVLPVHWKIGFSNRELSQRTELEAVALSNLALTRFTVYRKLA